MADTDDYLNELLGDISDTDEDDIFGSRSTRRERGSRRRRRDDEGRRSDRRSSRRDRRRAKRSHTSDEDSFLRSFERDLFGGQESDDDDFMDFGEDDSFGSLDDIFGDNTESERGSSEDSVPEEDFEDTDVGDSGADENPLGGIADIISEAKRQVSDEGDDVSPEPELSVAEPAVSDEIPDEPDLSLDEPVDEPVLMDENSDEVDLEDLLKSEAGDEDISDIEDLLNADEEGNELDESRESFEEAAASAKEGGAGAEGAEGEASADGEGEKKKGLLARILSAVGNFFLGPEEEEEQVVEEEPEEADAKPEETPEEKKARKKAEKEEKAKKKKEEADKKKKEKEAKKKEKEAKKKEKAAAKAKAKAAKKKKKDTSPKIPLPGILVTVLFGLSLVVLSRVFVSGVSYQSMMTQATDNYDKEDFIEAYRLVNGAELKDGDMNFRDKCKNLAYLQIKYRQYKCCLKIGKNQMALDSLISGVYFYQKNKKVANKLGITEVYNAQGAVLIKELLDSFDLTTDDVMKIYTIPTKKAYTAKIQEILEAVGMEVDS